MSSKQKKILIVDDDARNIFALMAVLRSKGYQCISATGMQEVENALKANDVGIILMDMMMPEMDGYEMIPEIRKRFPGANLPVIAVTAQAMVGDRERCLEAGADGYLSKPVNVDELISLLNMHV